MICSCLTCMLIVFESITASASSGGCCVHPTSTVVAAGERVLLTCTTNGSITSWEIGTNTVGKTLIYTAPLYRQDGSIGIPEKVSEGYFATRPAANETILHMNKTILSQAGLYTCTCDLWVTAVTTVVVLDSEPKFTTNHTGADGETVTFSCFVSFNASLDVSCELRMEDATGSTVARRNESTLKKGLIVCNLGHTVVADASSDQWHTCKAILSNKGDVIYSKVLNATVEWQQVTSTANVLSNGGESQTGTVIIIAAVVYFIIRSRERDKMLMRQHSKGQPTELSSDRPQRPPQCQRYDKKNIGVACFNDVQLDNKSLKENELTLFDNDLYIATSKQLDPSDGYFAEEAIYLEIQ